jgi:hypothetical protein
MTDSKFEAALYSNRGTKQGHRHPYPLRDFLLPGRSNTEQDAAVLCPRRKV